MFPHPQSDPAGHSFGQSHAPQADDFDYAVDLFNLGYYWEAHEAWEALWHEAGRRGPRADYLKGLIKLAAAGVKAREANAQGVRRHAQRASELFTTTGHLALIDFARDIASRAENLLDPSPGLVVRVLRPLSL